MSALYGPEPSCVTCNNCGSQVTTRVEFVATNRTHLIALLLCVIGCCPCAAGLYCTQCARNAHHYCPSCNKLIGIYER